MFTIRTRQQSRRVSGSASSGAKRLYSVQRLFYFHLEPHKELYMISKKTLLALLAASCLALGSAHAARADDDGDHDHGRGWEKHYSHDDDEYNHRHRDHDGDRREVVVIEDHDRAHIEDYMRHHHHHHHKGCPPGLEKKHDGCVPPGHDRAYVIGEPLPPQVVYEPVPVELTQELAPPPDGDQYVQVNQDVLLVSEATKKVIDAVTLLSAVGKNK
jgi:Ni/Co efflux regulator RcnB